MSSIKNVNTAKWPIPSYLINELNTHQTSKDHQHKKHVCSQKEQFICNQLVNKPNNHNSIGVNFNYTYCKNVNKKAMYNFKRLLMNRVLSCQHGQGSGNK